MSITRRSFLECSSLAMMAAMSSKTFAAGAGTGPLGKPIGLQLYTVREEASKDLLGTLKKLQTIGYRKVETAGFYGKSGKEMRKLFADHGMTAPSAHGSMGDIQKNMQKLVDGAAEVGAKYFVCAFPSLPPGVSLPTGVVDALAWSLVGAVDRHADAGLRADVVVQYSPGVPELLTAVRCPVVLVHGTRDPISTPDVGHWFAAGLADGRVEVWDGAAHQGVLLQWERFLDLTAAR
jgi:pimeloyl-ACP methyl ester carboxylesterase